SCISSAATVSEYRAGRSALLCRRTLPVPRSSAVQSSHASIFSVHSLLVLPCTVCNLLVICTVYSLWTSIVLSAVSGHLMYCPQSLVISRTVCEFLGHLLYCLQSLVIPCTVCSLWSSPVLSAVSGHPLYCLQSLVICTVSAVSGHPYCVRSLWSSPVLYP
ncbi:unnamed protein product, partial [Staurois parvus]